MKRTLVAAVLGIGLISQISAGVYAADSVALRAGMMSNLDFLKNAFEAQYAPTSWKNTFTQWSLDREIELAKATVSSKKSIGLKEYQQVLTRLFDSTRDYHTSISFIATEQSVLPFTIKGAEGRYFIVYIDRTQLPTDSFPFQVGDELISFDGKSADKAVKELLPEPINTDQTDLEEAEQSLTRRRASRGFAVPRGAVMIAVRPKGSERVFTHQLIWTYTEEKIPSLLSNAILLTGKVSDENRILNRSMIGGNHDVSRGASLVSNPFTVGARKTFTPALGKKIWESADNDPFHAYIYQNAERRLIGYVRIPSYVAAMHTKDSQTALEHFRKVVTLFESTTDAMVIDQVNNPGGSVFYLYALVSMLSDQAMSTPRHQMTITQADVMRSLTLLEKLNTVKNDADAKKVLTEDAYLASELDGYPASYEVAQFFRSYCQFLVDQFRAGKTLSDPYWIGGVDHINPASDRYTKPILLLTNALDFSGGDFFPAILQDNKRVTILGSRTAGAGGYVLDYQYPNLFGIDRFRLTASLAERANKNPIENLGVKPEIEYSISADDLQNGFTAYVRKINEVVGSMAK